MCKQRRVKRQSDIEQNRIFVSNLKLIVREKFLGNAAEYCRRAGLPRSTLQNCLKGKSPAVEILLRLAEAAGTNMDTIYTVDLHKENLRKALGTPIETPKQRGKYRQYD